VIILGTKEKGAKSNRKGNNVGVVLKEFGCGLVFHFRVVMK
jgi:hypothetical protein